MNGINDARVKDLLKRALPAADTELGRDLWPRMLQLLDERVQEREIPWFDWALLAILVICILAFPESVLVLLYHL